MTPYGDPNDLRLGLPTLLTRRQALGLLGGAGLVGGLAAYGINQLSDDKSRERSFDVRDYGAVGDGATDDTKAIQDAIAAAMPVSGTVYLPTGTYGISHELQLLGAGKAVTLVGEGHESSVIKALATAASVTWGQTPTGPGKTGMTLWGRPSLNHDWGFDGNLIATKGITIGTGVGYGTWQNIHSTKVNGDGMIVLPQNCTFIMCNSDGHAGNGWTLDYGVQACEFIQCHAASNDGWEFEIRQSGGYGWGGSAQPQNLRFTSGIAEQKGSPYFADTGLGGVHISEGTDIVFDSFNIAEVENAFVMTPSDASGPFRGIPGWIIIRDCRVYGGIHLDATVGGVAGPMGGTNEALYLTGWNHIDSIVNGSTATIYDDGLRPPDRYTTEGIGATKSLRRPPQGQPGPWQRR